MSPRTTARHPARRPLDPEKHPHSLELGHESLAKRGVAGLDAGAVAEWTPERTVFDRDIAPADDPVAPQQRQRVVAQFPLRTPACTPRTGLPPPEALESSRSCTIGSNGVRSRTASSGRQRREAGFLRGWPVPVSAPDPRMRKPVFRARQCRSPPRPPLRHAVAQPAQQATEAACGQGSVFVHHAVHERVHPLGNRGSSCGNEPGASARRTPGFHRRGVRRARARVVLSSSRCVLAFDEPPHQLVTLPCAKWASTSRGCTAPRSRMNPSTSSACRRRRAVHARRAVRGCINSLCARGRNP